jgi:hypothetical protein
MWKNKELHQLVLALMTGDYSISGEAYGHLLLLVGEIEGPEKAEDLNNATEATDDEFYLDDESSAILWEIRKLTLDSRKRKEHLSTKRDLKEI